jgi:hypothetical protein
MPASTYTCPRCASARRGYHSTDADLALLCPAGLPNSRRRPSTSSMPGMSSSAPCGISCTRGRPQLKCSAPSAVCVPTCKCLASECLLGCGHFRELQLACQLSCTADHHSVHVHCLEVPLAVPLQQFGV